MIFMISPEYFQVLFGEPTAEFLNYQIPYGVLLLVAGLIWQLIGAYLIYKIISIKV